MDEPYLLAFIAWCHSPCPCPCVNAALQVASRVFLAWGVVNLAPEVATGSQVAAIPIPGVGRVGLSFATLVIAWALSEIIRYGHFAAKVRG